MPGCRCRSTSVSDIRELNDPLIGSTVAGRYRIIKRLAAGGMGVVYEAMQEPLGRRVALKVIRGDSIDDPLAQLRFEREAKAASSIQDPHIVVVYDFGSLHSDSGSSGLFLAMEFVEGQTLRTFLQQGRVPWRRSFGLIEHIARGLGAAHSKGLVHRDLKPENVMLTATSAAGGELEFFCKVLDFGLAKSTDRGLFKNSAPGVGPNLTGSGGFVGTPGYISPEYIDGASEDPRQDVYALGVVWWEMLTSRHPFPAETPMKTLLRQMHEDPPMLDKVMCLADDIPDAGALLLRDMMARNAMHRPANGAEVLERLRAISEITPRRDSGIDSNAPTLVAVRDLPRPQTSSSAPINGIDIDVNPSQNSNATQRTSGPAATSATPHASIQQANTSQASTPPAISATPANATPAMGASLDALSAHQHTLHNAAGASDKRRPHFLRLLGGFFVACSVTGTLGGVLLMSVLEPDADPLPPVVVPVETARLTTELVIDGLSSFSAVGSLRAELPDHALRIYRAGHTEIDIDGDVADLLGGRLQGKILNVDGTMMILDVKELDRGRMVVGASVWVDAGVIVDAGSTALDDAVLDGGLGTVGHDGLEP